MAKTFLFTFNRNTPNDLQEINHVHLLRYHSKDEVNDVTQSAKLLNSSVKSSPAKSTSLVTQIIRIFTITVEILKGSFLLSMRASLLTAISNILEIFFELDRSWNLNSHIFCQRVRSWLQNKTALQSRDYDRITISCCSLSLSWSTQRTCFICR